MSIVSGTPFVFAGLPRALPAGYGVAPISVCETGAVRLSVVVKTDRKAGDAGPFVPLRETVDARVYLGCLADAGGRVHEWLELWVQDLTGLERAPVAYREVLTNKVLDDRWAARAEGLGKLDASLGGMGAGALVHTGFESRNPDPIIIDVRRLTPVPAKDKRSGAAWALCRDDALLASKGIPTYTASVSRNLYQPEAGDATAFLPLDMAGADGQAMGLAPDATPLNGGGGLMMAQRLAPLSFEGFNDAVTGVEGDGGDSETLLKTIAAAAMGNVAPGAPGGGWLMLSAAGREARLVEALHIKLMLLAGAAATVRAGVAATQKPMLNVTARSFRVAVGDGGGAMPLWWSARVALVEPGEGVELPIPSTQVKYYMSGRSGALSIYSPAGVAQAGTGRGWLRLRNIVADDSGGLVLEGTLSTQDRVLPGRNDLLWLRFALGPLRVDQYAVVDTRGSMAPGEIRIRTVAQKLSDDIAGRVKAALGVPIPEVTFEILPLLSSPCDLYALGVLAVRTLLVSKNSPLPVALDEILSLAGQAAKDADSGEDLEVRLEKLFADKRWGEVLGPQLLIADGGTPAQAFEVIPPKLWMGVLAATIRCFTGLGPDSTCKDYGDAPLGGLHRVFDRLIDNLYALLTACRTLIVADYRLNSEIRAVVQACLASAKT